MNSDSAECKGSAESEETRRHSFCKQLPKIELHAHISGCMRHDTINRFLAEAEKERVNCLVENDVYDQSKWGDKEPCSKAFKLTSIASTNLQNMETLFVEVIDDFRAHNVIYAEFRIGLKGPSKDNPEKLKKEKEDYCRSLIEVIRNHSKGITIKLLISIARHYAENEDPAKVKEYFMQVEDEIDVAKRLFKEGGEDPVVVGVEFSGNPYRGIGKWPSFAAAFIKAQEAGLGISLHIGERDQIFEEQRFSQGKEDEWLQMVEWLADHCEKGKYRVGHCTFISSQVAKVIKDHGIPVEICPTVAKRWMRVPNLKQLRVCQILSHPIIICSDNTTLNGTDLTQEYTIAMKDLQLDETEMAAMTRRAIEYAFCSKETKDEIRKQIECKL